MKLILNLVFIMLIIGLLVLIFGLFSCFKEPEEVRVNEEMVTICTIDMEKDSTLVCD